ncbi:MAG: TlpA disulfide reductase family protein, partial [Oricola sp.]
VDIEVSNIVGQTHILADFLPVDQPAILHFWATWCAPCREELPKLDRYAEFLSTIDIRDRLIVIAVEPSPRAQIDAYLAQDLGLESFAVLQDRDDKSGPAFGLTGLPETVLLDAEGRIVGRHSGTLDWSDSKVLEELSAHLGG